MKQNCPQDIASKVAQFSSFLSSFKLPPFSLKSVDLCCKYNGNMIEQLREKYIWKDGFSDMAKSGEEGGQIGGGRSKGSSEIILGEIFFLIGSNTFSTHGRFQLYPILPTHILLRLWKWPSKSKYLFFRASFSQPTSRIKWVGEPD